MSKRSTKLIMLSKFCDLEINKLDKDNFVNIDVLYEKSKRYHRLCQKTIKF